MDTRLFFAKHHVFTYDELAEFLKSQGSSNVKTRKALLDYHVKSGHILRIRRGIYLSVPPGVEPDNAPVDGYILASKMAEDAVLAYHTALDLHGKAHSIHERFLYLTGNRAKTHPLNFRGNEFRGVLFPRILRDKDQELFGVDQVERSGMWLRSTSLERTLVDVLDRPSLGGGWEEIWRSLESVEFFDIDAVVDYALLLENSTTVAKVGFYLETHRQELMVEEKHLRRLRKHRPKQRTYMVRDSERRKRSKKRLIRKWNLVVPEDILAQSWEETS
jgi:predicted transcriptional regulator of viral defense system